MDGNLTTDCTDHMDWSELRGIYRNRRLDIDNLRLANSNEDMPYPAFDRSRLKIQPLAQRQHDLDLSYLLPLDAPPPDFTHPALSTIGQRLVEAKAKAKGAARIALMGA